MNQSLLAFDAPNAPDMIVISILVLVLVGAKVLPFFGRSFGRSMDEFRRAIKNEFENELGRHWQIRGCAESSDRASLKVPVILFVAAIVILFVSLIAQRPH